jgi:predicted secreted protein
MKLIVIIAASCLLSVSAPAFATDSHTVKVASKATGKFAAKKLLLPLTFYTMTTDAMAACAQNGCKEEMTFQKGVEITGAVVSTQINEAKEAATGAYELMKVLIEKGSEL